MGKSYRSNHRYDTWRKKSNKSPNKKKHHQFEKLDKTTMRQARI
jgi:hypothetical protein